MKPTERGLLPIPGLSSLGSQAHVYPNLTNSSLISLGQLADDNCHIYLNKSHLYVIKNHEIILTGNRNLRDGLWDIVLTPTEHKANVIIKKSQTKIDLLNFIRGCLGNPTKSTFLRAARTGNLITFPGLDMDYINKHMQESIFSAKGHLKQEKMNLQSTKSSPSLQEYAPEKIQQRTHECLGLIMSFSDAQKGYMDLTGKFPHQSSRGNQYIMVVYDYDSNAILVEAIANRQAKSIADAWETIHQKLVKNTVPPNLYILDNECSDIFKSSLQKYNAHFQLVPPHIHRRNAAERAIQTFKDHFIACLASIDPTFPIAEWDRLLPQAELTLNLLRNSRINPKLSSYAYLFGNFDFNKTPLAPVGTKVLVHLKPDDRSSFSPRGVDGFYIGPSLDHYRCVKCFIPATNGVRDADTVEYFPHHFPIPEMQPIDYIKQATADIIHFLQNPSPTPISNLNDGDATLRAFQQLSTALNRTTTPPPEPPSMPTPVPRVEADPVAIPRVENDPVAIPRVDIPTILHPKPVEPSSPMPVVAPRVQPPSASPVTPLSPVIEQVQEQTEELKKRYQHIPIDDRMDLSYLSKPRYHPKARTFPQHSYGTRFRSQAAQHIAFNEFFSYHNPAVHHIYHPVTGKRQTIDELRNDPDPKIRERWDRATSNEWGRLAQGNDFGVTATDTIEFIPKSQVPSDRDVTYVTFVLDYRPTKDDPWRVRITVGGDRLSYPGDAGSPAASMLETKIMLNSVISDAHKGARWCTMDIKDHFLGTPMARPEYVKAHISKFPEDIIQRYNLRALMDSQGYVYMKIKKGMYGLKQAALLAYQYLIKQLAPHGYHPCKYSLGYWYHETRPTKFCLCVDDFGVKYFSKEDAQHLIDALEKTFTISVDWEGRKYCGFNINFNYDKGYVDIDMNGYTEKVRHREQHKDPKKPQYSPHKFNPPIYGKKAQQLATQHPSKIFLNPQQTTRIQRITGSLLYYARGVEYTMQPGLNELGTTQAKPTDFSNMEANQLLDYIATYPNATIRFYASDMVLHIDSDAAYLVLPNAKSRVAGYFYLSDKPPPPPAIPNPKPNGAILVECCSLKNTTTSAAETETAGVFHNAQVAIPIRIALEELGHPQPPTPLKTDNSTTEAFVHSNIRQRRSKSWDMRYNWLRDQEALKRFRIYWQQGIKNLADYFTKHHPTSHHIKMRPLYVHMANSLVNHFARVYCNLPISNGNPKRLTSNLCSLLTAQSDVLDKTVTMLSQYNI